MDFVLSGRLAIGGAISSSCAELWVDGPRLCECEWLPCIIIWGPVCESESVGVLLGLLLLTRLSDDPKINQIIINKHNYINMNRHKIYLNALWWLSSCTWNWVAACCYYRTNSAHQAPPVGSSSAPACWYLSSSRVEPMLPACPANKNITHDRILYMN